jgi:hypothetical protein
MSPYVCCGWSEVRRHMIADKLYHELHGCYRDELDSSEQEANQCCPRPRGSDI